jgi:alpha-L-arabinofuranosidase
VFAGEYACHGKGKKWNHFYTSLLEAAFMTGMERNADIVHMATYAPLFAHVEGWQWRPDMIWFDNLHSVKTVSYYVQQLFSLNKGTHVLPLTMNGIAITGADGQNGLFASAVWDNDQSEVIVKIVNTSEKRQPLQINVNGLKKSENLTNGRVIQLKSDEPDAENTIANPTLIVPVESEIVIDGHKLESAIDPHTFNIYKIKL